jgi:deoxyribonuclease-1-like protein
MRKLASLLLVLGLVGGGFLFLQKYEVRGLDRVEIVARDAAPDAEANTTGSSAATELPPARRGGTLRIASFNIQVLGQSKLAKTLSDGRPVVDILAEVVRQFDIVAVQEVRSKKQDVLPRLVEAINATGRKYAFVIGERLGRSSSKEQYAYIFDLETVEIDPQSVYTVSGFSRHLHRPPHVASFRARGPPPEEALTFTLINIHTDPDETKQELNALDDVIRSVRGKNPAEDDVILLGDLNVDDRHLGDVANLPYVRWVISSPAKTNTIQTKLYDNIIFNDRATEEFTKRAGVFDLVREFNITTDEATKVSDHFPVWAEFSSREGAGPGRLAAWSGDTTTNR